MHTLYRHKCTYTDRREESDVRRKEIARNIRKRQVGVGNERDYVKSLNSLGGQECSSIGLLRMFYCIERRDISEVM